MSGQHTQGRLVANAAGEIHAEGRELKPPYSAAAFSPSAADARRLAACWNACEGLDTEKLERMPEPFSDILSKTALDYVAGGSNLHRQNEQLRAELAAARGMLAEINGAIPEDHSDPLVDRLRALLGPKGSAQAVRCVEDMASLLVDYASALCVVVTISQKPRLPLAMGNYDTVFEVRPARGYY